MCTMDSSLLALFSFLYFCLNDFHLHWLILSRYEFVCFFLKFSILQPEPKFHQLCNTAFDCDVDCEVLFLQKFLCHSCFLLFLYSIAVSTTSVSHPRAAEISLSVLFSHLLFYITFSRVYAVFYKYQSSLSMVSRNCQLLSIGCNDQYADFFVLVS